ncbi:MAG: DnaJ domain-containing protein, partial [Elainellaceae cyanobacterium]
ADWIAQFTDPYAVLGLSVSADDRRVLKRYRAIAKQLHPDSQSLKSLEERDLANQLLAKLINPGYQRLKQDKGRAETVAMLRFRVRRLTRDGALEPESEAARRLLNTPIADVDVFYEQAVSKLAELQYQPISRFEAFTQELAELNLVYLRLKMGEPMIREKRTGLVSTPQVPPSRPSQPNSSEPQSVSYAERHYLRAQEYLKKGNAALAIQELRDAIKINARIAKYHALLARAYLIQNLPGAAKAYCRQALKLDPKDRLALACAKKLNISVQPSASETAAQPRKGSKSSERPQSRGQSQGQSRGLFGLFSRRR